VVTVSNSAGCTAQDSIIVQSSAAPVVQITAPGSLSFCEGDSTLLISNGGLAGWQWYSNYGLIANGTNQSIWVNYEAIFYCIGVNSNECSDTSNSLTTTIPCLTPLDPETKIIHGHSSAEFDVTLGSVSAEVVELSITCPSNLQVRFKLIDNLGRTIECKVEQQSFESYQLRMPPADGIYFVQVLCGNQQKTLKILK
jgi:hypothetical protein